MTSPTLTDCSFMDYIFLNWRWDDLDSSMVFVWHEPKIKPIMVDSNRQSIGLMSLCDF